MLKHLVEKEIRENVISSKFIITFTICSLLIILSFYVGAQNYKIAQARYTAAKSENIRQLEGLTDWLSVRDFKIFIPPNPLETLISGVSNDIGRTIQIDGRSELSAEDSRYGNDPIYAIFRFLDLEFIFQIVLSLLAILFAYDSINGEKERGTLRLVFANSLPRDKYLIGKILGSSASLIIPLFIPILIGVIIVNLSGITLSNDHWLKLSLILTCGILYVSLFITLSVFISSITFRSSNSFLLLLSIWIFFIILIPRISVIASGWLIDVPSLDEINSKKSRFMSQLFLEDRRNISIFKPTASNNPDEMMKEFNKFMQELSNKREEKFKQYASRLNEERTNKENIMHTLAFALSRISPSSSFSLAINELSGTSLKLQDSFYKAASDYQIQFSNFIYSKTGMNPGGFIRFRMIDDGEKPKPINTNELPVFQYNSIGFNDAFSFAIFDISLLIIFNLLFFTGAFFSFRKYDLR